MTVQYRKKGTSTWQTLTEDTTTSVESGSTTYNGILGYTYTPQYSTQYQVIFDGDETYDAVTSDISTQEVKAKVTMKYKLNNIKHIATLSGKVSPTHAGKKVIIKMKKKGGAWKTHKKIKISAKGQYSFNWNYVKGVYYFQAQYADTDHAKGTSSTIWIKVT